MSSQTRIRQFRGLCVASGWRQGGALHQINGSVYESDNESRMRNDLE